MSAPLQNHKILRQVLEVRGCPREAAARLGADMRRAYFERLVPAMDRLCSGASAPHRVQRIERLEIDLGEVPLDALEATVAERFEAAFAAQLAAVAHDAPPLDAELELVAFFVRTGAVPWWADRSDHALLEKSLEVLIQRAPRALRRALDPEPALRRLVRACPDRILERLAGVMGGPGPAEPWLAAIESAAMARGHPARSARIFWWEEVLHALQIGSTVSELGAAPFLRAVLVRVARRLGVDEKRMVADLPPELARQLTEPVVAKLDEPPAAQLERTLARLREILRLPPELQAQAAASLEAVFEERTTSVSSFSDADEIYVDNAGLVILWPFLERFFTNLGLLEQKVFKDEAARQRAVGLLQYLATGEAPQAEYLLPLNKLLCGMVLEEVFDFGEPPTEAELEACDELLAAVIQQAPVLREMSIPGFRASFLLRNGQLGARDGQWLLRVERLTHDIVLDRFPWSARIVKLPWMQAHMQVEW